MLPAEPLANLRQARNALVEVADGPLGIGVLGAYNAGKSSLLGALLGDPDLLPTGKTPTTGNVTALRLEPTDAPRPSRPDEVLVTFLTRQEAASCKRFLVSQIAEHAGKVKRPVTEVEEALALAEDAEDAPLDRWQRWCDQTWGTTDDNVPSLRLKIKELVDFLQAELIGGEVIGGDDRVAVRVPWNVVRQASTLGTLLPIGSMPPQKIMRAPAVSRGSATDASGLRTVLPLIRRITAEIGVPRSVWPLDGLRSPNDVVLVDFPGLGSSQSGLRDKFLARLELADIATVLVVVDATDPFRGEAMEIRTDYLTGVEDPQRRGESILFAASMFDLLDPPSRDLTRPEGGLTEAQVIGAHRQLQSLINLADALVSQGHPERIVFTSAQIHRLAAAGPRDGDGTPPSGPWTAVAERLAIGGPGFLNRALESVAADGGMDGLRRLIESHVESHGLAQRAALVRQRDAEFHVCMRELADSLDDERAVPEPEVSSRQALSKVLGDVAAELRRIIDSARSELTDIDRPIVRPGSASDEAGHGPTPRRLVEEIAADQVASWALWTELLEALEEQRIPRGRPDLPDTTGLFHRRFDSALQDMDRSVAEVSDKIVRSWVHAAKRRMEPLDTALTPLLVPVAGRLKGREDVRALARALRLSTIEHEAAEGGREFDAAPAEGAFPLADAEGSDGRWLPWHPDFPVDRDADFDLSSRNGHHQTRLMLLRRELTNALLRSGVVRLRRRLQRQSAQIVSTLEALRTAMPRSTSGEDFVGFVCGRGDHLGPADVAREIDLMLGEYEASTDGPAGWKPDDEDDTPDWMKGAGR
ncbi:dynamin family protein [Sphaerimonospora cavernae]|uniref:dynamin family protein n=1 Tax=Sphaerimonospora cavernae TaxID=1740611 RepID=UPI00373FD972